MHAVLGDRFGDVIVGMVQEYEYEWELLLEAHEQLLAARVRLLRVSLLPASEQILANCVQELAEFEQIVTVVLFVLFNIK